MITVDVRVTPLFSNSLGLYRVKEDQRTRFHGYAVRTHAPTPAVFRTGNIDNNLNMLKSRFTEPWQWHHIDLLSLSVFGKLYKDLDREQKAFIVQKFKGMTASQDFCHNYNGTDVRNCYPSGEIDRGGDPLQDPLICAWNIVEVMEVRVNKFEREMARLRSFDWRATPPAPSLSDTRVMYATWIDKDGGIHPFPHLDGKPVPYPNLTAEDCWYPLEELEPA